MSSYAYLCSSDRDGAYPSLNEPGFDPNRQTIACDVGGIPLVWLAMFRARDLKAAGDEEDSEDDLAPVVKKSVALKRLQTPSALDHLFAAYGPLGPFASRLLEAVAGAPGQFVTIEFDEVAAEGDPEAYQARLRKALAVLARGPAAVAKLEPAPMENRSKRTVADFPSRIEAIKYLRERTSAGLKEISDALAANEDNVAVTLAAYQARRTPAERAADRWGEFVRAGRAGQSESDEPWEWFVQISQLPMGRRFPDPDVARSGGPEEDIVALTRLLGAEHFRPVPW